MYYNLSRYWHWHLSIYWKITEKTETKKPRECQKWKSELWISMTAFLYYFACHSFGRDFQSLENLFQMLQWILIHVEGITSTFIVIWIAHGLKIVFALNKKRSFFKNILIQGEKGGERERERQTDRHQCERKASINCLPFAPGRGVKPATSVCALTWNWTCNLLVCGTTFQPTEPSGQGKRRDFC